MGIAWRSWGLVAFLQNNRSIFLTACLCLALVLIQLFHVNPGVSRSSTAATDVIISEIAWGGTAASENGEWLELYNPDASAVE